MRKRYIIYASDGSSANIYAKNSTEARAMGEEISGTKDIRVERRKNLTADLVNQEISIKPFRKS